MSLPLLINKQPVLDATQALYAYQLKVEAPPGKNLTTEQWEAAIKDQWRHIQDHIGFNELTANKPVFYQAPLPLLKLDLLPPIASLSKLIVEIDIDILKDKAALLAIKEMIQQGVQIALQDYQPTPEHDKLLSFAKLVKFKVVDFNEQSLDELLTKLQQKNFKVIITGVDSEETYSTMKNKGAHYFQGYFFTNPIISSQKEVASNKLAMLKLLAEVNDPDIEFDVLAKTIGSDVGLTHKLLAAINHPQNNLPKIIDSLKQAVNFMGLKRLKFWVNMLMLSEVSEVPTELLVTALVRAKFLESLATSIGQDVIKERFFMVGLFSTLNAFLKTPMVDIVDQLPLSDSIKAALTDQKGMMGQALFIARALEQGNTHMIMTGFEGADIMVISNDYMNATGWANQTLNSLSAA
ncbi:MAG: diguanylate phosphodiesterase [Piscirickettsiaceae bacterium CG_4_9_14_3_um_filter_43_564]|nr:HDOD domain-containing protein [Thiomicrospira sp.]OIP96072.1 MAG: hypothetical protein AUK56_03300 [Thiomicrospira sp. CG2_30_44_34]PIQ03123.1 MAG: diguanylate phosphodiesterase [Piscirickettsiaceae bacterium CG18_big_fil_WC_8_21_14_2_50_44_103]PIU39606.1 MAG: diguanylate phosphodiesterase [Piscirickettsiaceae bacterium CG07_land_8_20_14_0_80_44_28]PIW57145.1 MAG: diguanylate phosphodiesterase [Piscirickettsiaceae bacterium CG12_big_fil_rev_8_21_14_0_65_44_934]PIW78554.1 MAG: diguanylate p